ncbi:MAG: dienelactone hydrolase family protein [Usitatibacter sp.]
MTTGAWLARALACAFLAASAAPATAEDDARRQIPARVELHPIRTLTLSDPQFLRGDPSGKAVTIAGELRIAQGEGRLPAVVLLHGSSGVGNNIDGWVRELNAQGISTFVVDGFTGRGLVTVGQDQAQLGRLNLILDAFRALDILAHHPRVEPRRIALMGFSRGGQAALYASVRRFNDLWNKSGVEFAAHIAFYPDCATTYRADTEITSHPVRIFHGALDDYNPVAPCKHYIERLRAVGRDAQLTEYPNAQHSFDSPLGPVTPGVSRGSQTVRKCRIREESAGLLVNAATGEPFTYRDPCVERDPHTGYDPVAAAAAHRAVGEVLEQVFGAR